MNENPILHGKTGTTVQAVEYSKSDTTGAAVFTVQLRYWRAVHSELMTHRVFSRNASSSRAIPTTKLLEQVRSTPASPVKWGLNQSGMQALSENDSSVVDPFSGELLDRETAWNRAAVHAAEWASAFAQAGYHKEVTNRLIEPFTYISVVVTATQWDNFFELRCHTDAQADIHELADLIRDAMAASSPRVVHSGNATDPRTWHLPYVTMEERRSSASITDLLAMSAARCARVSYLTHDKESPTFDADISLYERLVESKPLHASPLEHQAFNSGADLVSRNLTGGWIQHRTLLEKAGSLERFRQIAQTS